MSLTGIFDSLLFGADSAPAKPDGEVAARPPVRRDRRGKRPAPFSLRLSADERARLEAEAAGAPLGAFIKAKVLGGPAPAPVRRRRVAARVEDAQALGRVLALLGASRLSSNLNQLAHAANIGALPLDAETDAELRAALADVRAMRRLLLQALGLKTDVADDEGSDDAVGFSGDDDVSVRAGDLRSMSAAGGREDRP